jgi:predicted DNA-binding protein (MmcQ/YjbR family)
VKSTFTHAVFARARRLCLAFPETAETAAWGHPNFRAGKKTFCTYEMVSGRPSIAFRLSATDVDRALRRKQFFATPYGRGRWVSVWADAAIDWKLVTSLLECSYRLVAGKRLLGILGSRPTQLGIFNPV